MQQEGFVEKSLAVSFFAFLSIFSSLISFVLVQMSVWLAGLLQLPI